MKPMSRLGAIKKGLTASAEESPKPYAPQGEKTGPESQLPAEGRPAKRPTGEGRDLGHLKPSAGKAHHCRDGGRVTLKHSPEGPACTV